MLSFASKRSTKKVQHTGVPSVPVIKEMRRGCTMIIIEWDDCRLNSIHSDDYYLSQNNTTIECCSTHNTFIKMNDVNNISNCNDEEVFSILSYLDIPGLQHIGLKGLIIKLSFKNNESKPLMIIFDSIQTKSIWHYGLQNILCSNKLAASLKSESLRLVIGNENELLLNNDSTGSIQKYEKNRIKRKSRFDFVNATFVESIRDDIEKITDSVTFSIKYQSSHCIFGSDNHLNLLSESTECSELLNDVKMLLLMNDNNKQCLFSRNNNEIDYLKIYWIKLNAKLAILCLKNIDLKNAISEAGNRKLIGMEDIHDLSPSSSIPNQFIGDI